MDNNEIEKAQVHSMTEIIDYVPHKVVYRNLLKKPTGHIRIVAIAAGEELTGKTYPFDTLIEIIQGNAVVVIESKPYSLSIGQLIVIPAHAKNSFLAKECFKMQVSIIKSGYEEDL
jgi:quercetin dioxygenase-like cupin family protein